MNETIPTESPSTGEATPTESQGTEAASAEPDLAQRVVEIIKTVYDPEIPVNIYELGLIYEIDVRAENAVYVKMTLTSPMCPVAETLPPEVEQKVRMVEGVGDVELELVWDPPWDPEMMSEAAKLELNM
jgi:FeS assembly SUF system protein